MGKRMEAATLAVFRQLGRCSLRTLHALGAVAGLCVYALSRNYRRRLQANLQQALGRVPSGALLRQTACETGRMMFELPFVWQRPLPEVLNKVLEVEGWQHVEAAQRAGKAIVALTPHFGCFEIISLFIGERLPMTVLYRPPKQAFLSPLMEAGRGQGRIQLAPANLSGVRRLIRALRQGEATGLLPDQAPGTGEGVWAPFFGRPAYSMTLAARLSEVENATVLWFWAERVVGQGWRLRVTPPSEPWQGDVNARVRLMNAQLEALILRCPSQYLWAYNRYKRPAGADAPPEESV